MAKSNQHVVPLGNGWAVTAEGRKTASIITSRQSDAISYARDIARKYQGEVIIHGRDGKVRARSSYGHEPFPPKGEVSI